MDNYSQQDVWLEIQTNNVKTATEYLGEVTLIEETTWRNTRTQRGTGFLIHAERL
ncbi:hypothetical protein ACM26V_15550 [Salipaludibacillus sp. HK11]|uniref:hypothetical protein n=1 Tax=Salipaludibacillus sp. HK11 TaxID=3394320 RepID=UPI0039FCAD90